LKLNNNKKYEILLYFASFFIDKMSRRCSQLLDCQDDDKIN
jgi:hypothetical protein